MAPLPTAMQIAPTRGGGLVNAATSKSMRVPMGETSARVRNEAVDAGVATLSLPIPPFWLLLALRIGKHHRPCLMAIEASEKQPQESKAPHAANAMSESRDHMRASYFSATLPARAPKARAAPQNEQAPSLRRAVESNACAIQSLARPSTQKTATPVISKAVSNSGCTSSRR